MSTQTNHIPHPTTPRTLEARSRNDFDAYESLSAGAERFNSAHADEYRDPVESFDHLIPASWSLL